MNSLCEEVLTIFLSKGEFVLIEIISFKMYQKQTKGGHGALCSDPSIVHGKRNYTINRKFSIPIRGKRY